MAAQIIAIIIFLVMFALIISDKIERHIVTLCCACTTLIVVFGICLRSIPAVMETLNVKTIFTLDFWYHTGTASEATSGINWATILFIAGMMVRLKDGPQRIFQMAVLMIAKAVKYKVIPIFITFMIMSSGFFQCSSTA